MTETVTNKHWYEYNPGRLQMEKMAMTTLFPEFEFLMVNDGNVKNEVGKDKLAIDDNCRQAKRLELRERLKHITRINIPAGNDVEMKKRRELRSDPIEILRRSPNERERERVALSTIKTIDGKIVHD